MGAQIVPQGPQVIIRSDPSRVEIRAPKNWSHTMSRFRTHGLLKKIGKRYKYYLTTLGRTVATAALKLRELGISPMLNQPVAA